MGEQKEKVWRMNMGVWALLCLVIVLGVSGSIAAMVSTMMRPQHSIGELGMPGEHTIALPQAGFHVIYYEFLRTDDRKNVIRPAGFEELQLSLADSSGALLTLENAPDRYDYALRYTRGVAAYSFTTSQAGTYTLLGEFPADVIGHNVNLAIKSVNPNLYAQTFFAVMLGLFITALLSASVIVYGLKNYRPESA